WLCENEFRCGKKYVLVGVLQLTFGDIVVSEGGATQRKELLSVQRQRVPRGGEAARLFFSKQMPDQRDGAGMDGGRAARREDPVRGIDDPGATRCRDPRAQFCQTARHGRRGGHLAPGEDPGAMEHTQACAVRRDPAALGMMSADEIENGRVLRGGASPS